MNQDQAKKLKDLVGETNVFAVIAGSPEEYIDLARVALTMALAERTNTSVYAVPPLPDTVRALWGELIGGYKDESAIHTTTLSMRNDRHDAKEVKYEKNSEHLAITVTYAGKPITQSDVEVSRNDENVGAVFYLSSAVPESTAEVSSAILQNNNINLKNTDKCVAVTQADKTVSEKVYDIVSSLAQNALSNKKIVTILFASLITETKNFTLHVSEGALNVGAALLERGADKDLVRRIAKSHARAAPTQLIGRALARMSEHAELASTWTFLSRADFEKTGSAPSDAVLVAIMSALREGNRAQPTTIVLYEVDNEVHVAVDGTRKIEIPTGPFKNFSEAERIIRDSLK